MIAIIDYGAGNLGSVHKAFRYIGADVCVTRDPGDVESADALVLPGVGAFGHCMSGLSSVNLTEPTMRFLESGRPFLGICVGLQMLFKGSDETDADAGLGVFKGRVVRFDTGQSSTTVESEGWKSCHGIRPAAGNGTKTGRLKVPHMGWNELDFRKDTALFRGLNPGERVYFVHSYYPEPEDPTIITARSDYGGRFCCAVESGNIHATQFHPEKSGAAGLQILRNFVRLAS